MLDEELVFHGECIYEFGLAHSGAPLLERGKVKRILWPEGVDPEKYRIPR